jgi:hypothetical protein
VAIAMGGIATHEGQRGRLVAGVDVDDRLPVAGQAQQLETTQPELLAAGLGPFVVPVLRQQIALVQRECSIRRGAVIVGERALGR